jgi:hypothetical protein
MSDSSARRKAGNDPAKERQAEFFMAADIALLGSGGLFRVYADGDALLMLRVGTYFAPLGVEVGRKGRGGNWLGWAADAAKPVISGAVLIGVVVLVILLRMIIRGRQTVGGALDFLLIIGVFAVFFAGLVLWFIRGSIKRAALLDAMTPDERRTEAEHNRKNRLLRAGDIAEASLDKAAGGWGSDKIVPAKLTLTLHPKGKRKLRLENRKDVKLAAKAVRRLIGKENFAVNVPLKEQE